MNNTLSTELKCVSRYPNGESSSPYVFVCSNPRELMMKFPMSGKHKIYKLDSSVHQTAKKSLMKM